MVALAASVLYWARTTPAQTACVYQDNPVTYGELAMRVRHTAGGLRARGVVAGDRVALLMKNSQAYLELSLAISYLGAVLLPVNYRLGLEEVAYILEHAGARLLCVDVEFANIVPADMPCLTLDAAAQADTRRLDPQAEPVPQPWSLQADDLFRLMYTSGTTDRPKGVMHSYANFYWKTLDHICSLGLSRADTLLMVGPLYHVGAFDLPGVALLLVGGSVVILRDFDPHAVLHAIARYRISGAWFAPVMLNRLLTVDAGVDVSSLRWAIGGGERTPVERIHSFQAFFPNARYIDGYGLTESCSGDTLMQAGREIEKIGSAGRALAHVQLEIRDEQGKPMPTGQAGEICLQGPKIMRQYWKDPERTQASFFGNWFRTGDVGYVDDEGFLYLVDRKKDMIISGGENIASSEVERVLYQLTEVEEAAVIGLPDAQWGERVVAVVVPRPDSTLTLDTVQAHCRNKLGGFKIPRQVILHPGLPRNPSGKVLKRVLRDQLAEERVP